MVERADRHLIGWQEWHYCGCDDPTTSGPGSKQAIVVDPAKPPTGDNLITKTLDVLVRPHPRVIAGTPTALRYDAGTKEMTTRWSTERADGRGRFGGAAVTELVVPRRAIPGAFSVHVAGGALRSAAGERLVRVTACAGSPEVAVKILPGGTDSATCDGPARLLVKVTPRRLRAGTAASLRVVVDRVLRAGARPARLRGATVRAAGRLARTDRRGVAVLRVRPARAGLLTVHVKAPGARHTHARVRVRR